MLPSSLKLSRVATATVARTARLGLTSFKLSSSSPYRLIHDGVIKSPNANPVALQMIDYALSLAKSQKSGFVYIFYIISLSFLIPLFTYRLIMQMNRMPKLCQSQSSASLLNLVKTKMLLPIIQREWSCLLCLAYYLQGLSFVPFFYLTWFYNIDLACWKCCIDF